MRPGLSEAEIELVTADVRRAHTSEQIIELTRVNRGYDSKPNSTNELRGDHSEKYSTL